MVMRLEDDEDIKEDEETRNSFEKQISYKRKYNDSYGVKLYKSCILGESDPLYEAFLRVN